MFWFVLGCVCLGYWWPCFRLPIGLVFALRIGLLRAVVIVDFVVLGLVFWLPCGFGCVAWFAGGYC